MEDTLLDSNAYDTWMKELPHHVKGFNELRKERLPDYDIDTDNPYAFAESIWQFIFDDEEEIDNVVTTMEKILNELQ